MMFDNYIADVDECARVSSDVNPVCDQICVNTVGSFECGCRDRHSLAPDGRTCVGKLRSSHTLYKGCLNTCIIICCCGRWLNHVFESRPIEANLLFSRGSKNLRWPELKVNKQLKEIYLWMEFCFIFLISQLLDITHRYFQNEFQILTLNKIAACLLCCPFRQSASAASAILTVCLNNILVDNLFVRVELPASTWCYDQFGCNHQCQSTAFGMRCSCRKGYRLHSNGKDCIGNSRIIF